MSHEALPLDAPAFARALEDLPVDALHSRAAEIQNSIAHLKSSNEQMVPFADEGDQGTRVSTSTSTQMQVALQPIPQMKRYF